MKHYIRVFLILFLFLFLFGNPCSAGLIDCNEQGSRGRRVCEEREVLIEHEEVFNERTITYELEKTETTAEPPSTASNTGETPSDARASRPTSTPSSPTNDSSGAATRENGHYLTCVSQQDYNNISQFIDGGRSGSTGNEYHDKLIRSGQIKPNSGEIWIGNRVALVCPDHAGQANTGQGSGARNSGGRSNANTDNSASTSNELQEMLASPTESDNFRLVPVESLRSWTETWYETVVEQFCWWVPGDAIVDPVTLKPINTDPTADNPNTSEDPVPEPATMLLFGSIMAFLPVFKKRFWG